MIPLTGTGRCFTKTLSVIRDVQNFVSAFVFEHKVTRYLELNEALYYPVREKFGLRSQMTQSALKTVLAKYRSVKGSGHPFTKISFSRFEYDLVWNRDYSVRGQAVSVNSLAGRLKIPYEPKRMGHWLSRGIRRATERVCTKQRYVTVSWPFYEFRKMLEYKAALSGSRVIAVNPAYTSQDCPVCRDRSKKNRDRKNHEYHCRKCGYRSNDDRVGAMNLYLAGRKLPETA